ncbi:hypothetical protein [Pyxidicoccus trucidator]|uniref:hypothetical protein n=1 Tax=Pyxidicoccus trucidator TaxID=2709662 RepID=UPI0013DD06FB|nr:hypothetical protein [Pyxidicoccus trucidator]
MVEVLLKLSAPPRLVGYWKGTGEDARWPHPRDLVDPSWEKERRQQIVSYLQRGVVILECLGYSHCRFPGGPPGAQMGCRELSDGAWCWPEGLAIYVRDYDVRLPDEFVAHMAANGFCVPEGLDRAELLELGYDPRFWIEWARREVPPFWSWRGLRRRLGRARRPR